MPSCLHPISLLVFQAKPFQFVFVLGKLWTAPELLRAGDSAAPTFKSDVYSFGIVCQEIIFRSGVFHISDLEDPQPEGILAKLVIPDN